MRNSFNNFIVNESNKEAFDVASRVAKDEKVGNGLVLIYGDHATGKSHLLDAVWHEYLNVEDKHAEWMSKEGFKANIESINCDITTAMSRLNEISLLLVNDIDAVIDDTNGHFIAQLFEKLLEAGKLICLTSSKKPNDIADTMFADLLSRNTCVETKLPSKEERIDFYKKVAKKQGVGIYGDDAYDYLASNYLDYRTMLGSLLLLKYKLVMENAETTDLGKAGIQKYLESIKINN